MPTPQNVGVMTFQEGSRRRISSVSGAIALHEDFENPWSAGPCQREIYVMRRKLDGSETRCDGAG